MFILKETWRSNLTVSVLSLLSSLNTSVAVSTLAFKVENVLLKQNLWCPHLLSFSSHHIDPQHTNWISLTWNQTGRGGPWLHLIPLLISYANLWHPSWAFGSTGQARGGFELRQPKIHCGDVRSPAPPPSSCYGRYDLQHGDSPVPKVLPQALMNPLQSNELLLPPNIQRGKAANKLKACSWLWSKSWIFNVLIFFPKSLFTILPTKHQLF